jgi:hypothetical protein
MSKFDPNEEDLPQYEYKEWIEKIKKYCLSRQDIINIKNNNEEVHVTIFSISIAPGKLNEEINIFDFASVTGLLLINNSTACTF